MAEETNRQKLERWRNTAFQQLANPSGIHVSDHAVKEIAHGVIWLLENTLLDDPDRIDNLKGHNRQLAEVNEAQSRELEQLRRENERQRERLDELERQAIDASHARGLEGEHQVVE